MTKKLYHWLNGNTTDSQNSTILLASQDASVVTNSSRWFGGANSAFQIGDPNTANSRATYYYQPNDGSLPNIGTGDITIAFWWKPGTRSFVSNPHMNVRYFLRYGPIHIANNPPSGISQASFDMRAYFQYDDGGGNPVTVAKTWRLDLTGNPWVHVYASRINGVILMEMS